MTGVPCREEADLERPGGVVHLERYEVETGIVLDDGHATARGGERLGDLRVRALQERPVGDAGVLGRAVEEDALFAFLSDRSR
jgi:hypothetical protein